MDEELLRNHHEAIDATFAVFGEAADEEEQKQILLKTEQEFLEEKNKEAAEEKALKVACMVGAMSCWRGARQCVLDKEPFHPRTVAAVARALCSLTARPTPLAPQGDSRFPPALLWSTLNWLTSRLHNSGDAPDPERAGALVGAGAWDALVHLLLFPPSRDVLAAAKRRVLPADAGDTEMHTLYVGHLLSMFMFLFPESVKRQKLIDQLPEYNDYKFPYSFSLHSELKEAPSLVRTGKGSTVLLDVLAVCSLQREPNVARQAAGLLFLYFTSGKGGAAKAGTVDELLQGKYLPLMVTRILASDLSSSPSPAASSVWAQCFGAREGSLELAAMYVSILLTAAVQQRLPPSYELVSALLKLLRAYCPRGGAPALADVFSSVCAVFSLLHQQPNASQLCSREWSLPALSPSVPSSSPLPLNLHLIYCNLEAECFGRLCPAAGLLIDAHQALFPAPPHRDDDKERMDAWLDALGWPFVERTPQEMVVLLGLSDTLKSSGLWEQHLDAATEVLLGPHAVPKCANPTCPSRQKAAKPQLRLCSRCKRVRYCSVDCQRKDWPTHKPTCDAVAASLASKQQQQQKKQ